ncbi:MAG: choline kinase, partial [Deltaproteobacteria bacterium]|nr:choline kinase [Deltaproteobacteria bacterium]
AVDFQYAGRGCAMKDLAYLLHGRTDEPADGIAHDHLDTYFRHLRAALAPHVAVAALEAEWRSLYPVARLDFCRFLAGWRPASWKRDQRGQRFVRTALADVLR